MRGRAFRTTAWWVMGLDKRGDWLPSRVAHKGVAEMRWLERRRLDQLQAAQWDAGDCPPTV